MSVANQFAARVALYALRGICTVNEIAKENDVAPTQVSAWKRDHESRIEEIFEGTSKIARELVQKEHREGRAGKTGRY